jgi:YhcH/YjgK/YiaL family protein
MVVCRLDSAQEVTMFPPVLRKVIELLRDSGDEGPEPGWVGVETATVEVKRVTYETEPEASRRFETHRQNVDVQLLLEGTERIFWANRERLRVTEDYDEERDIVFHAGDAEAAIDMAPGVVAVFFPTDAHKPNCSPGGKPVHVHKIVVKIPADALVLR